MLRKLQAFFVLWVCVAVIPAAAQELTEEPTYYNDQQSAQAGTAPAVSEEPAYEPTSEDQQSAQASTGTPAAGGANPAAGTTPPTKPPPAATPPDAEDGLLEGWHIDLTGYFRAPVALGISERKGPDELEDPDAEKHLQVSYGPNRTVDSAYYSFGYTRLQEQDWVELSVHAKKKHVDAAVGWLGYWLAAAGYRNYDASWWPGIAYLKLDTDVEVDPGFKPNVALTVGSWWPRFGYFEKYDTFTLGQFRQVGEQLKLTLPLNSDFTVAIVQGFGTGRDGSMVDTGTKISPIYETETGLDLLHYYNIRFTYQKYLDIGVHFNNEWTDDPFLRDGDTTGTGKAFTTDASKAHLTVVGGEAGLSAPYVGRLWISPSYISVKNGWALDNAGTEVMHSLGGAGISTNYMGYSNTPLYCNGSGEMINVGFLYEESLSRILDKTTGSVMPEVTLNVFGLLADVSVDLPALPPDIPPEQVPQIESMLPPKSLTQLKWGADVTVQPLIWLAVMLRYDSVNLYTDEPGYIYSAITPRLVFSSHFLSGESIYIQYSHYFYGDYIVLAGLWPWGTDIVAGSHVIQSSKYNGETPDEDVIKLQATVAF